MVVSGLLIKFPYWVCWKIRQLTGRLHGIVFYVDSEHDYQIIEYILPYLDRPYSVVARNRKIAINLRKRNITVSVWPVFPALLIMTRHAFHRFPVGDLKKIGVKHGPNFFKRMIHPNKFNAFDLHLFCSVYELEKTIKAGVNCGIVGGYPRIDAFKDPKVIDMCRAISRADEFDVTKKNLLFTSTWDRSGQSGIHKWIDHLGSLISVYNIAVSLHPMMQKSLVKKVMNTHGIHLVSPNMLPAYMLWADFLIGDTSSVLAEFCVLDKPMITFSVQGGARLTEDIQEMIKDFSSHIADIGELDTAINSYLADPSYKKENRQKWRSLLFDDTGVSHGKKAAKIINAFIDKRNPA